MPLEGTLVEDLDAGDCCADDSGFDAASDDLDLRKFRHASQPESGYRPESSVHARRAAAISACFLLVPSPDAVTAVPTDTVATNTFA